MGGGLTTVTAAAPPARRLARRPGSRGRLAAVLAIVLNRRFERPTRRREVPMAQQQQQAQPAPPLGASATTVEGEQLSLAEMSRIMDVATTLRKERALVEHQLNIDEVKAELRRRLLEAAEITGDSITAAEVDAAVDQYYDRLHTFEEPPLSVASLLAHLYVRRAAIAKWAIAIGIAATLFWGMFLAGLFPGERRERLLSERQFARVEQLVQQIESVSTDPAADAKLARLQAAAGASRDERDAQGVAEAADRMRRLAAALNAEYVLEIPSRAEQESAFPMDYTDESGTRRSGYYVIVRAAGPQGEPVEQPIRDRQRDAVETVSRWAEQVPEDVYNRLRDDKQSDGLLDERIFGRKQRGKIDLDVQLPNAQGDPLERGGQLTQW